MESQKITKSLLILFLLAMRCYGANFSHDFDASLKKASKAGKPLLVAFHAIWCPPCNEMEEVVYESRQFLEQSSAFELVKVDADSKASWKLKSKYKIGGYPTLLFIDSKGEELYRVLGSRTIAEMVRIMKMVQVSKKIPLKKACESKLEEDLWRCAVICGERKDESCLNKALSALQSKVVKGSTRDIELRNLILDQEKNESLKRNGLETLLKDYPTYPRVLFWANDFWDLSSKEDPVAPKKTFLSKILQQAPPKSDPVGDEIGISNADQWEAKASLLEKLEEVEQAKVAWTEFARLMDELISKLPPGSAGRSLTLNKIGALAAAGKLDEALSLSKQYEAKYPKEFTFHLRSATILMRQKKYPEALADAKQAYGVAYGDNKIRVATIMMKLYGPLLQKDAGKSLHEEILKEFQLDKNLEVRTHKYLEQFEATWKQLVAMK